MNFGPFALSSSVVLLLAAGMVAFGVGHLVGRGQHTGLGSILMDMSIVGVLVARVAFIASWFDMYRSTPWSMLDIRDGGYMPWAGGGAALLMAIWRGWRQASLRIPLLLGLSAAALVWAAVFGALRMTEKPSLPEVSLTTLAGEPTSLATLFARKPIVVNLWASWCPPCRREMPVLAAAQQRETGMDFVFVNQGEDADTTLRYLKVDQIDISNVLIDPDTHLGREVGSYALPTTLFYDANGFLMATHTGALSHASLASKLNGLRAGTDFSSKE